MRLGQQGDVLSEQRHSALTPGGQRSTGLDHLEGHDQVGGAEHVQRLQTEFGMSLRDESQIRLSSTPDAWLRRDISAMPRHPSVERVTHAVSVRGDD